MRSGPQHPCGKARILIADDHPLVRDGLVRLLADQKDLCCCGESSTVAETLGAVARFNPDLILLDLRLKSGDGLELIKSLVGQFPKVRILVLSQHNEHMFVERALRAGAMGYVLKDQAAEEVLEAMRTVIAGEIYLSSALTAGMLSKLVASPDARAADCLERLTDRELHVLQLLGSGLSTREIAAELNLSFKTVETHRENLKNKLRIRGASELVNYAISLFGSEPAGSRAR